MALLKPPVSALEQAATAVRQTQDAYPRSDTSIARKPPADRSRRLVAVLNRRFRGMDDGIQWMLEQQKGKATPKSTGWRACGPYVRTLDQLLKYIEQYEIAPEALSLLEALPEKHPSLTRSEFKRRKSRA